ncbi:MAG: FtsQ-type POTRA domain-containing protein [Bacilli bacterium]|nr:FtsQ-type POTRA domain-containing protein [Bacilli bacterium]
MATKIVKKTKIKLFNFLIVLLILVGLFFGVRFVMHEPIHNLIVKGNNYLKDDVILELAKVKDYPSFLLLKEGNTCKKVEKSPYIASCKIKKRWGFVLEIDVVEERPLFFDMNNNQYVFGEKKSVAVDSISERFRVPRLLNYVPDKKYSKFITGMSRVEEDTLSKISDIEYQPNDYDKDRFLLYMDDGNMVYLTLTKFKMINHYNEVLSQLEGHKGILYLDSGNHFQIME